MVLTPRQSSSTRAQVEPGAILLQLHCLAATVSVKMRRTWPSNFPSKAREAIRERHRRESCVHMSF